MFQSILADIRREFLTGNVISRLVIVNVSVFILINLIKILLYFSGGGELPAIYERILHFFCISSDFIHNITHPWTFLTSIFLHEGFWHLLWNMLFLFWFGRIVADLIGNDKILTLYLLSGIVGCFAFWLSAQMLPYAEGRIVYALGASAGVMGIVVASGTIAPNYIVRLLFLGEVKLKYLVFAIVFLDLVGIANNVNTGGHFAHIGGAFMGWFIMYQLRQGNDWSEGVNALITKLVHFFRDTDSTTKGKARHFASKKKQDNPDDNDFQDRLDYILEKIHQFGYDSLTDEERRFLDRASKQK
jgi:membrane associated rhomboid family serine protease